MMASSLSCAGGQARFLSTLSIWALAVSIGWFDGLVARGMPECASDLKRFDTRVHKRKYTIAIHATEGFDVALTTYNKTFSEYLTATAGQRFDAPLEFELVPVNFEDLMQGIDNEAVDFMFSNPSTYTCVGVEEGAQPLATIVERLDVNGKVYETDTFAGVMFTLAENEDINGVEDFKDKVIGAVGVSVLNAGLTQFNEMSLAGMSYVMDPKQVTFTGNQNDVVEGVLNGEFDVGFVRTGQIERYRDTMGRSIDRDTFKILQPKIHVQDDGNLFPFLHSTGIFPEYVVSALDSTPHDVVDEVHDALLALSAHAEAWELLDQCESSFAGCDIQTTATRCDTSIEVARVAATAARIGHFFGFRSPKSYFDVRSIQQVVGFMDIDKKGNWQCTKHQTLFEKLPCPEGHYKLSKEAFENSCARNGLRCKEQYSCYCKPCVKTHEVEVFQYPAVNKTASTEVQQGCDKMDLCGTIEQTKTITFRIIDNLKREGVSVGATIHVGDTHDKTAVNLTANETYTYEFSWTGEFTGIVLLEIDFDDEFIAESPLRFEVVDRKCAVEFPGSGTAPSLDGECLCKDGSKNFFGRCLSRANITTCSCIAALILILVSGNHLLRQRTRQIDALWKIEIDELTFEDPPVVIGQGSFGVVIRAEFRGINVAIKRAVKPKKSSRYGSTNLGQSSAYQMGQDASEKDEYPDFDGDEENDPKTNMSAMVRTGTSGGHLGFLHQFRTRKRGLVNLRRSTEFSQSYLKATMLGDSVSQTTQKNLFEQMLPCFDPQRKRAENFMREMRTLSRLRRKCLVLQQFVSYNVNVLDPCITSVYGAVVVNPRDPMLVMEHLEYGSLTEGLLQNETIHLNGEIIVQVARDVVQGLRYLHSTNPPILHGDLKGKNILIDSRFRAKLCDFGLSTKKKSAISGTPYWLPPEYLVGDSEYTMFCDVYSFGVVLYEMYSRKSPYEGEDFETVLKEVCNPRIKRRPKIPPSTPTRMVELMNKCWNANPFNRPNARDLDTTMMDMQAVDAEPLSGQGAGKQAKVRTGDMLYEIFPKHIADTLKAGKKPDAEHHDLCTIVFSDIVGFTAISHSTSPLKVSEMLDRLYLAFDEIATKHNVFKMETIGDAYMGVTNLQGDQNHNHVKLVAEFAADMIKEASRILIDEDDPSLGFIKIRVGFHSGPVVSNVIGTLNPRYGLFGDTVNTANRMESNSRASRILCSEYSHNLLRQQAPEIRVRRRGKIDVKGRGEMKVFWVGDPVEGDTSFSQSGISTEGGFHVGFHDDEKSVDSAPVPEQNPRSILRPTSPTKKVANFIGSIVRPMSPFKSPSRSPLKPPSQSNTGNQSNAPERLPQKEPKHRTLYPVRPAMKLPDEKVVATEVVREISPQTSSTPSTSSEEENIIVLVDQEACDSSTVGSTHANDDISLELYDAVMVVHNNIELEAVVAYFAPDNGAIVGVRLTGSSVGKGETPLQFHCPPNCGLLCPRSALSKRSLSRLQELSLRRDLAELTLRREMTRQQQKGAHQHHQETDLSWKVVG